jgi:hypothetical protein
MANSVAEPPPVLGPAVVYRMLCSMSSIGYSGPTSVLVDGKELGRVPCLFIGQDERLGEIALFFCLVRGICGSLIRSNGAGKVGSRSRRTRCRWASAPFRSQLPFAPLGPPW